MGTNIKWHADTVAEIDRLTTLLQPGQAKRFQLPAFAGHG